MTNVLLIIFYLLAPALVLFLIKKNPFLNKIGPILLLYLVGIIIGNIGILNEQSVKIQDLLTTITIPIAIPLLLFSCNFREWSVKKASLTLLAGVIAVVTVTVAGFFIFNSQLDQNPLVHGELYKLSGMLTGVYTGGTPNLAALKLMLNVQNETYIMVHSYDMIISLLYLTFLLSIGIKLFRKLLPPSKNDLTTDPQGHIDVPQEEDYKDFFKRENFGPALGAIGVSILILAIAGALSLLFASSYQMVVIILTLTTLGIVASFIKPIRNIKKSYDAGMYLVLIFSLVVASMANLSKLNLSGGLYIFLYIAFVVFGSLIIQILLSKLFKIDADSMIVSSVALINSPPFVPLIATAMGNRKVIITGLTVGLVGYAVGNYLGFIIAETLKVCLNL